MIPVDAATRASLNERPVEDFVTQLFVSRPPTKLEDKTSWLSDLPVRPVADIIVSQKQNIPETELAAFTTLKFVVTERDRMHTAWKKAWKYSPAQHWGTLVGAIPGGSQVMPSLGGMISGTAVGLSTVMFQKTLEFLDKDLSQIISEQQKRPGIRRLATLKFRE
jgi:hypothetical protein